MQARSLRNALGDDREIGARNGGALDRVAVMLPWRNGLSRIAHWLEHAPEVSSLGLARAVSLVAETSSVLCDSDGSGRSDALAERIWWVADGVQVCPPHELSGHQQARPGAVGMDMPLRPNHRHSRLVATAGLTSLLLGASIIVELPTALPYFAAIAAIRGSGTALSDRLAALALYNVCFVLPLMAIVGPLLTTGERAQRIPESGRSQLHARWPSALAGPLLSGGSVVIVVAFVGLVSA